MIGACIHYRAIFDPRAPKPIENSACAAGVNYLALAGVAKPVPDWLERLPCFGDRASVKPCDKRQLPTREQIQAEQDEIAESFGMVMKAIAAMKATKLPAGEIPCPKCSGRLYFATASNGHTRGQCETENCVGWIE